MTKLVMLTPARYNKYATVDDDDFDRVSQYHWSYNIGRSNTVHRRLNDRRLPLANFVLNIPPGTIVDHIDRNPLNNTKSNLRVATPSQNSANKVMRWRSKTGFIGVYEQDGRYRAQITLNNKRINLGTYATAKEAAIARDKAARELHGEFAILNFSNEDE